jgi:tetratricopeptide (TPR) repeat protein
LELINEGLSQQNLPEVKTKQSPDVQIINQTNTQTTRQKPSEPDKDIIGPEVLSVAESNILDTNKLDQALRIAKRKSKDGNHAEAKNIYKDILQKFPKHKKALTTLKLLKGGDTLTPKDPSSSLLQPIIDLYNQGKLQHALSSSNQMLERYPTSVSLYNIAGASYAGLMQLDDAITSYKQALKLNPNCAEAYYNMGLALSEKGALSAAIDSYKKAININPHYAEVYNNMGLALHLKGESVAAISSFKKALKIIPNYAEAYNNMGSALRGNGDLESAINSHKKAIKINPHYAEAYYNLGNTLQRKGNLKSAIDSYKHALKINPNHAQSYYNMGNALRDNDDLEAAIKKYKQALEIKPDFIEAYNNMASILQIKGDLNASIQSYQDALSIKPDHAASFVNCESLQIQISKYYNVDDELKSLANKSLDAQLVENPTHQISLTINDFIQGDNPAAIKRLNRYNELVQAGKTKDLADSDQLFCNAYAKFIDHLIKQSPITPTLNKKKIYHIGESHCLSYAHHTLTTEQQTFCISPVITFGAKAYHFSKPQENQYKSITKWNLDTLPNGSIVFISFGEIDCRAHEGLIQASHKTGTSLEILVENMIKGYLAWFLDANKTNMHRYKFFNVPAPVYRVNYTLEVNNEVANVIDLFNKSLKHQVKNSAVDLIDVYQVTKNESGFSNKCYHSDEVHLDHRILGVIEDQIRIST